jgi:plastocyanin
VRRAAWLLLAIVAVGDVASCRRASDLDGESAVVAGPRGNITGRIRVEGTPPVNEPLRMRSDPMCDRANNGQRVNDDATKADPVGGLANVFVQLDGAFPDSAVPKDPVTIDQRGCVYRPRVIGLRVGQALEVRNSDDGLHNVHGTLKDDDGFNVSQPTAGMTNAFHPSHPGMLQLKCDVHTWMVAYVGVVEHPFYAVTGADGAFEIRDVPVGTYSLRAWHEVLGDMTSSVRVEAGSAADVGIVFDANHHRAGRSGL